MLVRTITLLVFLSHTLICCPLCGGRIQFRTRPTGYTRMNPGPPVSFRIGYLGKMHGEPWHR